ncbi:MAG: DUF302 domain-containing protein [Gammaproteobacteria bacterium]
MSSYTLRHVAFPWLLLFAALALRPAMAAQQNSSAMDITATVLKLPLAKGVSIDDAISSMKLRANMLNFKLVAHQPLSEQLKASGVKNVRRLEIYQFCNPATAYDMVRFNMAYAAYLPCRIAVVEDKEGRAWLVMMDPQQLLSPNMPPKLRKKAQRVIDDLKQIMRAGAEGAL